MAADRKTKIAEAFLSLAQKRDVDKITVKALIDECHISRQTFYYHFQDIMDVMEWTCQREIERMLAVSLKTDTPQEALEIFISSAVKNHTLFCRLLNSQRRAFMEKMFVSAARTYLQEMAKEKAPSLPSSYSDIEVALDYWAFGITGILFHYGGRKDLDISRLAGQIFSILTGKIIA